MISNMISNIWYHMMSNDDDDDNLIHMYKLWCYNTKLWWYHVHDIIVLIYIQIDTIKYDVVNGNYGNGQK